MAHICTTLFGKHCFLSKMDFLNEYKDMFGKPNEGVHKYRVLDVPIVDYAMTIMVSFIIALYTNIPVVFVTIIMFGLGVFSHIIFGVKTSTTDFLI